MQETPQDVVSRCLDFWRGDLYASNGVATPFATDAIIGELALAGYSITHEEAVSPSCGCKFHARFCTNP